MNQTHENLRHPDVAAQTSVQTEEGIAFRAQVAQMRADHDRALEPVQMPDVFELPDSERLAVSGPGESKYQLSPTQQQLYNKLATFDDYRAAAMVDHGAARTQIEDFNSGLDRHAIVQLDKDLRRAFEIYVRHTRLRMQTVRELREARHQR